MYTKMGGPQLQRYLCTVSSDSKRFWKLVTVVGDDSPGGDSMSQICSSWSVILLGRSALPSAASCCLWGN
jgi:hypothetical protein